MASKRESLVTWLKDAYALESQSIETLERQVERLDDWPDLQTRVRSHLDETHDQRRRVGDCLNRLGADPSLMKGATMKFMGNMQAFMNATADDEVLKDALADVALENYEVASYRSLIAAAEDVGEPEIAATCRDILRQEEAMAAWVVQHIEPLTRQYLAQKR